jgi:hypothetical protein
MGKSSRGGDSNNQEGDLNRRGGLNSQLGENDNSI